MLSDTAEYALRAVLYIADRSPDEPLPVDIVAEALGVPRNYLSKTLHHLVKEGVLSSQRGPRGGFMLALPPGELTLLRVVEAFDDITATRRCLLGRPKCSDTNPCPAHDRWKSVAEDIAFFFRGTTVEELLTMPDHARRVAAMRT